MRFLVYFFLMATLECCPDSFSLAQPIPAQIRENPRFQALLYTPPAYRTEALRLMVADANRTANELGLPEHLPITTSNLMEVYVSPPRLSQISRTIGTISTSNYLYAPFAGRAFVVVRKDLETLEASFRVQYLWPESRMDTNAAYQDAAQILRKVGIAMDVLNRDCRVHIMTSIREGQNNLFVPIYWVTWSEKTPGPLSSGASVELFEPTKTILQLQVFGSQYILRKPLEITNIDFLLSQTNTPGSTNSSASP
jgi:hypothetical protein